MLTRRRFLGSGMAALCAPGVLRFGHLLRAPALTTDPFALGVASGVPRADGFVLWTRLAGSEAAGDVKVGFEIAADDGFAKIVRSGEATAEAGFAHSVHLEVTGL